MYHTAPPAAGGGLGIGLAVTGSPMTASILGISLACIALGITLLLVRRERRRRAILSAQAA